MTAEPTTTTTSMDHPKNEKKETKAATQHPRPANPVLAAASRITRAAFQQGTRVTSGVATATERTVTTAFHVVADGVETTVSTAVHTVADGVTFVGQTAAATVGLKSPAAAGSEAPPPSDDAPRQKSTPAEAITTDHDDVSTIPAATADKDAHHYFTMGPMLEFLTADATLLFVFVFSVALYPTWNHWDSLWEVRKVVTPVLWPWLLTAFCGGLAIGQQSDSHRWFLSWTPQAEPRQTAAAVAAGESVDQRERFVQDEKRNKHSLFLGVLGNQSSSVKFESGVSKSFRQPLTEEEVKFWSILSVKKSSSSHRSFRVPSWQLNMDPCQDQQYKDLVRMLLGHENVRRSRPNVGSLEGVVIEPLFQLRGVDVFLSDDPEPEPSTHPWLVQQGLRDRPTFTLNILTQWGNILIYFEMPAWVRNFHTPEDENDADDVKALKVRSDSECDPSAYVSSCRSF